MTMTAEQLAQLRAVAERAKELGGISRYTKAMVANLDFSETFTPVVALALLDELERKDKRIAELEARTVTVKLPGRCDCCYSEAEAALFDGVQSECVEEFKSACAAAGINLTVEG
ncbi:ead/Ea22-like family protein [Atlantibacter sp.]|uniref:ead/Ea22-like family protein n=1 Tax=Atlantibacter sp. TaxID=1903473 RepID=UPI0028AB0135|nr:ead/Ea22-like family protein [Atlantibacter sp.]